MAVTNAGLLSSSVVREPVELKGYPLLHLTQLNPFVTKDELDVAALQELSLVRAVSRLAPMLGLIATMIPMGPALKSLSNGNVQEISDNLIVAFSAVIFGLTTASLTFWIATVKKNWLAKELVIISTLRESGVMAQKNRSPGRAIHEAA